MTELDLSRLEALRERKPSRRKASEWSPVDLNDLHPGTYLAADPSITAFGLVLFEVDPEHRCAVHIAEQFSTSVGAGPQGWADFLDRAEVIESMLGGWLRQWVVGHDWGTVMAVHEAPPQGGGKLNKPESSVAAGLAFRIAIKHAYADRDDRPTMLPMVRRQDHAKLVCGNANADKKTHHAALKELFDGIRGADELITNESKRDSLSVAIAAAKRGY